MAGLPFAVPDISDNAEGWGPSSESIPPHLKDVPFAPFSKTDKLGKAADWTNQYNQKYSGRQNPVATVFTFFQNEEEDNFHIVDNRPVKTSKFQQRRVQQQRFQQQRREREQRDGERKKPTDRGPQGGRGGRGGFGGFRHDQQRIQYAPSVDIRPEWAVKEQIPFSALAKLSCRVERLAGPLGGTGWERRQWLHQDDLGRLGWFEGGDGCSAPCGWRRCKGRHLAGQREQQRLSALADWTRPTGSGWAAAAGQGGSGGCGSGQAAAAGQGGSGGVGDPTDLGDYGSVEFYDKAYDKITARQEKTLERTQRGFRNVTTSDDPVVRKLAAEGAGRVFATDSILATLMTAKSSVYSWDVVITRVGDKLFIDKRDGGPLDMLTVNETAPEQIPEDRDNINGVQQLALEATAVNQYRKWQLAPGLDIVVRCEVNAALTTPKGEVQLASIKALNEWNLKETDWRKKLDQSRASMLLTEAKNNKAKVARWTVEALLTGCEAIKWGYVTRAGPRDNANHVVLNVQTSKPRDFAGQIQLSMEHGWGIVRALVDMIMAMDE
ncbi:Eukaryotic translation initiation factor 3 subunit D-2, partial [Monoraphidium neglectum]